MNEKKQTLVISILTVIAIVVIIAIFVIAANKEKIQEKLKPMQIDKQNVIENQIENEIQNQIENQIPNEIENKIKEDTNTAQMGTTSSSETLQEKPKTAEEKAIDLVKKDWGSSAEVNFNVEGMNSNGEYVVVVRANGTTQARAFYYVDIQQGTFTKKQIN